MCIRPLSEVILCDLRIVSVRSEVGKLSSPVNRLHFAPDCRPPARNPMRPRARRAAFPGMLAKQFDKAACNVHPPPSRTVADRASAEAWRSRKHLDSSAGNRLESIHAAAIEDELDEHPRQKAMAEGWRTWARALARLRGRAIPLSRRGGPGPRHFFSGAGCACPAGGLRAADWLCPGEGGTSARVTRSTSGSN
jgi:hypothetical protein